MMSRWEVIERRVNVSCENGTWSKVECRKQERIVMEPLCSMQCCSDENEEMKGLKHGRKGTKREGIAGTSGGVCVRTKEDNGLSLASLFFSMVMLP